MNQPLLTINRSALINASVRFFLLPYLFNSKFTIWSSKPKTKKVAKLMCTRLFSIIPGLKTGIRSRIKQPLVDVNCCKVGIFSFWWV